MSVILAVLDTSTGSQMHLFKLYDKFGKEWIHLSKIPSIVLQGDNFCDKLLSLHHSPSEKKNKKKKKTKKKKKKKKKQEGHGGPVTLT